MPTNKAGRTVIDGLFPYVPVMVSIDAGSMLRLFALEGTWLDVGRPGDIATAERELA